MSLTLYLLRHGETVYSKTGSYCGELDAELTPEGVLMAKAFAEAYRTLPWADIYVSPKKRTVATALPLCEATGISMQLRDSIKEIAYGEWEGKSPEEVEQNYSQDYLRWLAEPAWNSPPGGETAVEVANRAMSLIAEIQATHSSGNVLVVSHKATIRIILCSLMGIDLGRYRDRIDAPACSISVVHFVVHGPLLKVLGDQSYMDSSLRNLSGT